MGTGIVEFRQLWEVGVFSYLVISCLKIHEMVLGVVRPEMAMDSRFHEVEPMLDEGAPSMDSPWTDLGLLKTIRIVCWIEIVHVNLLELDNMILL